jgi:hypothetical protein
LEVLPCRFEVTPQGVEYLGTAALILPDLWSANQTSEVWD